ncbi:MAG: MFS transporter, partial [Chitinophagales bacterium]|nr:MFS transporter [Chitinophagales bacterium]
YFNLALPLHFLKMKKGLFALAIGAFGIGVTEFSMMGMLEDVAAYLQISIPKAGHLISIYALGVVVGAPLLVLFSSKYSPKKLLISLMVLFALFNGLTALVPNYHLFLLGRFLSGLPHGAFFGVGTIVASKIAEKGKEARSISYMFTGLTVANLLGVPFATFIGHHVSWRWSFLGISLIGILAVILITLWIPNYLQADTSISVKKQLNYFRRLQSWWLIAIISIGTGAMFAWISYISPMMTQSAGFSKDIVPRFMILAGFGMFVGNLLGGRLADIIPPSKVTFYVFILLCFSLITVYFSIHYKPMAILMTFVTGTVAFTIGSPIQLMLIQSGKGSEIIAAASGQASFNIGNALGAFLGGLPIAANYSMHSPQLVGASLSILGSILVYFYFKAYDI